ncbi:MAG: heparinase II/III family protein [Tannerella sp.]|jgi:hypothetical protein|nr:heparinase II/III family protein [Tannerella sp.]
MKKYFIIVSLLTLGCVQLRAQADREKIQTVEDVCRAYPETVKSLFEALNPDYPGLEKVKTACREGKLPEACKYLLDYYGKSKRIVPKEKLPPISQRTNAAADTILRDTYTFQEVKGTVPRLPNGHLKWTHNGPKDDIEWAWALNRHYPVRDLLLAYAETGNPDYVRYIDSFVKSWIICSWPYPAAKSNTAMWRGLEVSFREKVWDSVFYELWNTGQISQATQILILAALPSHAHYARNFHAGGNWLTMEMSGLATVAGAWPEFREAPQWMDYSVGTMVAGMKEQVYPDGVQTELTSSYHQVALSNFNLFAGLCKASGISLPEYYRRTVKDMWNYLAWTIRPDGFGLLNNDADLVYNRGPILEAAGKYRCPEWTYIASNGADGTKPDTGPSCFFLWAGHLISRSGYDSQAHWSFFDIGPWGSGHQHNDKLHLSVSAYGRDLLIDAGRFAYRGEVAQKFRAYATGSQGHNLILVDGKGQDRGTAVATAPVNGKDFLIAENFDYGSGTFDRFADTEGSFSHTRSVMYIRNRFWIVADRLKTDRPRRIETLWHWHPACKVSILNNGSAASGNEYGNLTIIPVGEQPWETELITGQEDPVQGWYSRVYNTYEPNTTSVFSTNLAADDLFVWLLYPSGKSAPAGIEATILSKRDDSVSIRISEPGTGEWIIRLPFLNREDIEYTFTVEN